MIYEASDINSMLDVIDKELGQDMWSGDLEFIADSIKIKHVSRVDTARREVVVLIDSAEGRIYKGLINERSLLKIRSFKATYSGKVIFEWSAKD